LLRRLVADGRDVRALVRRESDGRVVADLGAEPIRGDLRNLSSVARAVAGCRTVFHVAGINEMCSSDIDQMHRVNVDGSRTIVAAAAAAGVERVVHTSSAAVIGEPAGAVASESTGFTGDLSAYGRTKRLAEEVVFATALDAGIDLVAVNPASVQGPGRTGGTARILLGFLTGKLRFAVDTTLSLVYIDDCVEAHLLAERRGIAGERYLVSGITTTVPEALDLLARVSGVERKVRTVPVRLVAALAPFVSAAFRLVRRQPPLCPEMARIMRHGAAYDGSRISRELGLVYTPPETWLSTTIEWYREQGLA
jgi:dihydroflavonol-4-reductase